MMSYNYDSIPMQYTAIFTAVKRQFSVKIFDCFYIFVLNIDCGYTLEPPQSMFRAKIRTKCIPLQTNVTI